MIKVKEIEVPDVSNLSVVEAEKKLEEKGFIVADEVKNVSSAEIKEGNIVKTSPQAGSTRKEGAEITLYVSTGEKGYVVEKLAGQNYLEVKGVLEKMYGLTVFIDYVEADSKYNANEIVKTEPSEGARLTEGDSITIFVPDMTAVYPDFTENKMSLKEIEAWCEKYSIELLPVYTETDEYKAGTIYDQSQPADSDVYSGQTLKIYIAQELINEDPEGEGEGDIPEGGNEGEPEVTE